jgi:hypothetical protein
MSIFDFYKKNFPSPFSEKSIVSIMLSFVNLENQVVSIRFLVKFGKFWSRGFFCIHLGNVKILFIP